MDGQKYKPDREWKNMLMEKIVLSFKKRSTPAVLQWSNDSIFKNYEIRVREMRWQAYYDFELVRRYEI